MLPLSSSIFDSLPARPPTPPRDISKDAVEEAITFLDDANEIDRLTSSSRIAPDSANRASDITPSSSQDNTELSNAAKKVDFSPYPTYHKVARPGQLSSPSAQLLKRSPSRRDARPLKSILKLSNEPPPTPDDLDSKVSYFSPQNPGSFAKMLQSVIQQLASSSRDSRLDAYLALNGALQAYDNVPDAGSMVQRMDLMMQFLSRDIAWKDSEGKMDVNIASQALKTTMALLFDSTLSAALDNDFKTTVVDRSIAVLELPDSPKALVKLHMSLLAQNRLHSSILTTGRAEKVVAALQTIEDRCSGNGIVAARFVVYQRLLERAPTIMLNKMREWLEHGFHGMLSSIKDIRTRAIDTCTRAALVFGQHPYAAKALQEMFDTEVEEGQSYCDYLRMRLIDMITDKEAGACVPQIWSAVILFFRNKRNPLEKWRKFKSSWLPIIQRCFNASDVSVRYQAALAWNKLVFAVMPDSTTTKNIVTMLTIPIRTGLDKHGADKFSKQIRGFALDSYYNLLHYGLRPGLSNEEHDAAWDEYVDRILSETIKSSGKGRYIACRVLRGLVNGSTGVWNGNAALATTPVKPEDLPRLDPRWVRSRLGKILKLLEPMISAGMMASPEANATLDEAWHSLVQSVADAGSQEVKTTHDLKEAIVVLVNLFRRIWSNSYSEGRVDEHRWLARYISLVDAMVVKLTPAPFTEEILATTKDDSIEVASTPSHRPSKHQSAPQSPMVILFGQFYQPPSAYTIDRTYRQSIQTVLLRFLSSKSTSSRKLELLAQALHTWSDQYGTDVDSTVQGQLWTVIAETATQLLNSECSSPDEQEPQDLGHGLRYALNILLAGLRLNLNGSLSDQIFQLFDAMHDTAKTGAGDGGVVLAVLEPLSKALVTADHSVSFDSKLVLAAHILGRTPWPRSCQSLDQARKALLGVGLASHKATIFDPFDHVYTLVVDMMVGAYNKLVFLTPSSLDTALNFLSSVVAFLNASPPSLLVTALRKTQNGFTPWIVDNDRRTSVDEAIANAVRTIWPALIRLLKTMPTKDSSLLKVMEPLLVAGFSSPHRLIVNETILFWNETFGNEQALEYPTTLESVLRARIADAEIQLPTFPESNEDIIPASLPEFYDSQSQLVNDQSERKPVEGLRREGLTAAVCATQPQSAYFMAQRSPIGRQINISSPAKIASRGSGSSTPKAWLRHDDTQIQFAPIDSSPLPPEASQLLTEHQKEVKARQLRDAQIFPDLSSSPLTQSTTLSRALHKRLNFTSEVNTHDAEEGPGTPTALPDPNGLASDDMPSSPTPSSTKDARQGAIEVHDDSEERVDDPPSSPPRAADEDGERSKELLETYPLVGPDDTTVDVTDFANVADLDTADYEEPQDEHHAAHKEAEDNVDGQNTVPPSDIPSDSPLPAEQLRLEQEAGARALQSSAVHVEPHDTTAGETQNLFQDQDSQDQEETRVDVSVIEHAEGESQEHVVADELRQEVTRVENSFVEATDVQWNTGSPPSQSTKKRQRSSLTTYTAKKRKQRSPFKRWKSRIFGESQQDDDDEDIGEEIVVASSQPASSPVRHQEQEATATSQPDDANTESFGEPVKEEPSMMQPPPKRGRGRPRKSETPTAGQTEAGPTRELKRRASTISNVSATESQIFTSFVQDTPAPAKARKKRKGQDGQPTQISQAFQNVPATNRATRRSVAAVLVESTNVEAGNTEQAEHAEASSQQIADEENDSVSPDSQLAEEQAAALNNRRILTPRSILGRLRNALNDFRGMILGSQEEREFDDVLFELRREAHEAGWRRREEQQ